MILLVPETSSASPVLPPSLPRARSPWKFWTLWTFDLLVTLGFLYFFLTGLATATVLSAYLMTWAVLLGFFGVILGGGYSLHHKGKTTTAAVVLCMVAVPALLMALFFLVIIISSPRWN